MPNIGDVVGIYTIIDKVKSNDNRIYKCECNFCHNIFYRSCGEMKKNFALSAHWCCWRGANSY